MRHGTVCKDGISCIFSNFVHRIRTFRLIIWGKLKIKIMNGIIDFLNGFLQGLIRMRKPPDRADLTETPT